ncbi:hypothetical protein EAG18_21910 [Pseudoalteromonas sp. J010]|uniref:hypothetical protein n=1 Tax=Pseudoalteromonas sp. J010 TaxID=998465 RepID=UPI000F64A792|nr:hypothetical protein [Pseudoalteromonas sp. J010]RRS06509.1 hypothetical protein EAG18_21910 [Pseudoalteromonas sp. J010]
MKWLELLSRLFLVFWLGICVVDGWGYILFDYYLTGEPVTPFLSGLMGTMWFWVFFKVIQTLGVLSIAFNYKVPLGLFLLLPSTIIICLFYFFILQAFIPVAVLLIVATGILLKRHQDKFLPLLKS